MIPHTPALGQWFIQLYILLGTDDIGQLVFDWKPIEFHGSDEHTARLALAGYLADPDTRQFVRLIQI